MPDSFLLLVCLRSTWISWQSSRLCVNPRGHCVSFVRVHSEYYPAVPSYVSDLLPVGCTTDVNGPLKG